MYRRCLFCAADLGENQAVEHFPVGRRLAFDAAKGRLWVVCPHCERWNLTPVEERWDAIEDCERLFRSTVVRTSTDNIGVAQLGDGTRLIRIGKPLRPEFAAWRYGDQLGRRRKRSLWLGGAALFGAGGVAALASAGFGAVALVPLGVAAWNVFMASSLGVPFARGVGSGLSFRTTDGQLIDPARYLISDVELRAAEDGGLRLTLDAYERIVSDVRATRNMQVTRVTVDGREARWLASRIMPGYNRAGASAGLVRDAVSLIERAGGPEPFIPSMLAETRRLGLAYSPIEALPTDFRLALEMALHEDLERRAMEDELKDLEAAWREADRIAAIADNLFVDKKVTDKLKAMKKRLR